MWDSLADHHFGILFVTKSNFSAPWILFEAGALSKTVQSRVIPILCNVGRTKIANSPLNQFQNATRVKDDILQVVDAINLACERPLPPERLKATFEKWWPDFDQQFENIEFIEPENRADLQPRTNDERLDRIESSIEGVLGALQRMQSENKRTGIQRSVEIYPVNHQSPLSKLGDIKSFSAMSDEERLQMAERLRSLLDDSFNQSIKANGSVRHGETADGR